MHEFETNFKSDAYLEFTVDHLELPIFAVGIYLGMIQYVPDNLSKPWSVRTSWGLWNLLLSVFSMVGASRCIPKLLATFEDKGFTYTVCGGEGPYPPTPDDAYDVVKYPHYLSNWYTTGPSGLWVFLFIYSKLPELLDTAFLVFQKKPVIFLHWFHHVTVLLYCWHAYHHQVSSGLWFASMNYFVHSIMCVFYYTTQPESVISRSNRLHASGICTIS
jgi:elongation of very long chain fatty acids protein 6